MYQKTTQTDSNDNLNNNSTFHITYSLKITIVCVHYKPGASKTEISINTIAIFPYPLNIHHDYSPLFKVQKCRVCHLIERDYYNLDISIGHNYVGIDVCERFLQTHSIFVLPYVLTEGQTRMDDASCHVLHSHFTCFRW